MKPKTSPDEKHLNPHQLAQRWNLTYRTLERWRTQGIGPKFLKIGWRIMYRLADVEAYETAHLYSETIKDDGIPVTQSLPPCAASSRLARVAS